MASSRYKVQQFPGYLRMFDSYTEEPVDVDRELARFSVNLAEAEIIERGNWQMEIVDGDLVVHEIVEEVEG